MEKQKKIPSKNVRIDPQTEKCLRGDGWCRTNHKVAELHADKLKINFFTSGRLISITDPLRRTKQRNIFWYVRFSRWKGEFWIQEVNRARLDACLRVSSIDEIVEFKPLQASQNR